MLYDPGYDVKLHPAVILYMSLGIWGCPLHISQLPPPPLPPPFRVTILPQSGWQSWAATIHKLMVWCPSYCGLADDPFFVRTKARHTARVWERRHTQMPLKNWVGMSARTGDPVKTVVPYYHGNDNNRNSVRQCQQTSKLCWWHLRLGLLSGVGGRVGPLWRIK